MKRHQQPKQLTTRQRQALTACHNNQVRIDKDGRLHGETQTMITRLARRYWIDLTLNPDKQTARWVLTDTGRKELHRAIPDEPVYFTNGRIRYRLLNPDPANPKDLGRWVVDDGIPAEHRGYSTAREHQDHDDELEALGLTRDRRRASKTQDVDRTDPKDLHPHWQRDSHDRLYDSLTPRRRRTLALQHLRAA